MSNANGGVIRMERCVLCGRMTDVPFDRLISEPVSL